ncbi:MAG: amidophosphoribosyltransferase [Clostridia bacterium]|nr:amidophosphoribosyltransferase [Clostridia bacterium]
MGGIFGVCLDKACATDLFFGVDYHSHLGTRRAGMAVYNGKTYTRAIHNIENSPFRTKFESDLAELQGCVGVGCISDEFPQPIILNSRIGAFAVVTVGKINNKQSLVEHLIKEDNAYFTEMSGGRINDTELVASLICRKDSIPEGIRYAQSVIEGSMTMLVCAGGGIYAARDRLGRTPLFVGKKPDGEKGFCACSESFAYINLEFETYHELGPGEVVFFTEECMEQVYAPLKEMKMCSFLWLYYGFPSTVYEGSNVEAMRYQCGRNMAKQDEACGTVADVDYIAGIPDSGTPHAIGYSNQSRMPFARPLIKYTPTWARSFTPKDQSIRELVAKRKLSPVDALISGKKLLLIDDSIVRGTQMRGMMDALYADGAKELHGRIGCPPVLFACKYLNFTRSKDENENIARRAIIELEGTEDIADKIEQYTVFGSEKYKAMVDLIRKKLNLTSLEYHSLDGMLDAIGIEPCKLCTYCWNGKE